MSWARSALVLASTFLAFGLLARIQAQGEPPTRGWDTFSDTWAATDELGRTLPTFEQVGPPRKDRFVGIFYFLWSGSFNGAGPFDVTQILKTDPLAMSHPDSPLWGPMAAPHHWGQSLFGYYRDDDEYVLRKHAQMLSDAGVDVIIFDVSNGETYRSTYYKLLQVFSEIRAEGGRTPQIAFLCPFGEPGNVLRELYRDLYSTSNYKDLWFRWKGKPLILADPDMIGEHGSLDRLDKPWDIDPSGTLGQSFTVSRHFDSAGMRVMTFDKAGAGMTLTLYEKNPLGRRIAFERFENLPNNRWISLHFKRPLPPGDYYLAVSNVKGTVDWWSVKGQSNFGGQVFENGRPQAGGLALDLGTILDSGTPLDQFFTFRAPQPDYFIGPTKPDMWSWLEVYPQHVFRPSNGRKEQMSVGVAQNAVDNRLGSMSEVGAHGRAWHNGSNDPTPGAVDRGLNFQEQAERALKEDPEFVFVTGWNEWIAGRFPEFAGIKLPVMFVDEYNEEFSRDIEPMIGGHGDNYYYQLVSFIRRFKGVRSPPAAGPPKSIDIAGDFSQWNDVKPQFRDDRDDTSHRDHPSWNPSIRYVNTSGRNDFVSLKVSRDSDFAYFYAQTKDPITPFTEPHWMMLFIKVGVGPNWEGYQYVLNRIPADAAQCTLEQSAGGWNWSVKARVNYRIIGNEMQLAIRRADLGLADPSKPLRIEFKWMDNMQHEGDVNEFTLNGDAAPNERFNYVYFER